MKDKLKNFWKKYSFLFILVFPFLAMDVGMRIVGIKINYFRGEMVLPNILFIAIWVALAVGITVSLKKTAARIFYGIFFAVFFVMFLTNGIYYSLTGYFFSFNLLLMAGEGSEYITDTILNASPLFYLMALGVLGLFIIAEIKMPSREKNSYGKILLTVCVFLILHMATPVLLGASNDELSWDTWRNPHNVYINFNDSNKNMKICGLFEYTVRDFYMTFLKSEEPEDESELEFLEQAYSAQTLHEENLFTGIFEGKNVIFLQLEGMDSWLLNEEDTPNLYALMEDSLIFENHFSYYNGGGSTFNSELAVNTGFITPISYTRNAYTFNTNLFAYSLPNMFKERGYSVNAFHMNTEEYYSRGINYKNWGYDNYYGLIDEQHYSDLSYELDRELIENEAFYDRLFHQEGNFVHYIITYTPHTPFTASKGMGQYLAELVYDGEVPDLDEEACARMYAAETDYMVELLIQGLKDNGLYDNTVIVAYADHYLYTLNDKTILEQYKNTENNLVNQTPFFIWSSDLEELPSASAASEVSLPVRVDKVNSQLDILPTVLNMFGFQYVEEYYMGNDIFDDNYTGYAFFSDYSWYNGIVYAVGADEYEFVGDTKMSEEEIAEIYSLIADTIKKNDLTLKYDYFRKLPESE